MWKDWFILCKSGWDWVFNRGINSGILVSFEPFLNLSLLQPIKQITYCTRENIGWDNLCRAFTTWGNKASATTTFGFLGLWGVGQWPLTPLNGNTKKEAMGPGLSDRHHPLAKLDHFDERASKRKVQGMFAKREVNSTNIEMVFSKALHITWHPVSILPSIH